MDSNIASLVAIAGLIILACAGPTILGWFAATFDESYPSKALYSKYEFLMDRMDLAKTQDELNVLFEAGRKVHEEAEDHVESSVYFSKLKSKYEMAEDRLRRLGR